MVATYFPMQILVPMGNYKKLIDIARIIKILKLSKLRPYTVAKWDYFLLVNHTSSIFTQEPFWPECKRIIPDFLVPMDRVDAYAAD